MTFREPFLTPFKRQFQQQSAPDGIQPTNLNLFKNPIPFSQTDWPRVHSVILYVPDTPHTDINFYPNPIPFKLTEWPRVQPVKMAPPQPQPNITVLSTIVVANPFYTQDFATSHITPDYIPPPQYPNLVLQNFSTPFYTRDFAEPFVPIPAKPDQQSVNLSLLTQVVTAPFNQLDWPRSISVPSAPFEIANMVLYTADTTSAPFYTQDFSRPFVPVLAKSDQQSLNINLYTNPIPLGPYDWSTSSFFFSSRAKVGPVGSPNLLLTNPFYGQDFSQTKFPPSIISPLMVNNILLTPAGVPFSQLNWPKTSGISSVAADFYNMVLYTSTDNTAPFVPQDFSRPFVPIQSFANVQSVNTNLFTNPVPLNQIDWSKPYRLVPIASDQNSLPNLILYQPVVVNPSTPLGIYSWTDLYKYVTLHPNTPALLPNLTLVIPPPAPDVAVGGWRWIDGVMRMREKQLDRRDQNASAVMLGKLGGIARAQALTTKQRSNIASKAAQVRWNPPAKKR